MCFNNPKIWAVFVTSMRLLRIYEAHTDQNVTALEKQRERSDILTLLNTVTKKVDEQLSESRSNGVSELYHTTIFLLPICRFDLSHRFWQWHSQLAANVKFTHSFCFCLQPCYCLRQLYDDSQSFNKASPHLGTIFLFTLYRKPY